jgi:Amidohydrolase
VGAITLAELFPNGGATMSQADVDQLNAIRTDATNTYRDIFMARATAAAQSGKYVGFGELAPLHYSLKSGQPYMIYKVDTSGMLWLSDLAAQYNMVLDIHLEATDTTLAEFANLLSHNTNTRIIWDHAGWSNSGFATAAVFSQMLADHPNLYLNLKMRSGAQLAAGSPTDDNGNLKPEWNTLLTTYADRIMVGTDAKYWGSPNTIDDELAGSYTLLDSMLRLLPPETAQKIRKDTATTLFNQLKSMPLSAGWNFVSFPKQPADTAIDKVLADVSPSIAVVWGYDTAAKQWKKYKPLAASNQLTTIESGKGYWIYMNAPGTMSMAGWGAPTTSIHLGEGWNLIGYAGSDGAPVSGLSTSIGGNWDIIWTWNSGAWSAKHATLTTLPVPALTILNRERAYWIEIRQGRTADWNQ